jgi:putative ABC transport system ATP-binding protein
MSTQQSDGFIQAIQLGKTVSTVNNDTAEPLVILNDINFSVSAGTSVAVLGASGSGKTTLLGLLAGLDEASSGRIIIDGVDLGSLDEDGRAQLRAGKVGFVFQNFQLLSGLTALENVMLPLELAAADNPRNMAEEYLGRVGLAGRLHHYPSQLSGGEQQRCAIARAFAASPQVLFADEPTGNLDSATGKRIIELLFDLNREQGTTLVMATHDEALAEKCQVRLSLKAGQRV